MKKSSYYKKVGSYNLIREIGSGSFARVYRGISEITGQDVAVKMIQKQSMRAENINMIEKEIDILLKLDHPNIIKLLDYKRTVNNFYLIFEFCEHGDLDNYIRNNSDNKKLPESEVKRIMKQLAKAMEKLHSLRIVHRDLKLANILVNKEFQIKLADFGFAKYSEDEQFLVSYCGTPLTMAPEVLKRFKKLYYTNNREKYNEKCDIWSVGIIIYQMLYGQAPFVPPKGGNINDLIRMIDTQDLKFPETPQVTDQVKKLLQGMLQREWKERYSPQQFFRSYWFQDEQIYQQPNLFLHSILKQSESEFNHQHHPELTGIHKISEDFNDMEIQNKDDEILTSSEQDQQLKHLAGVIRQELRQFLQHYLEVVMKLDDICKQLFELNKNLDGFIEVRNLYLSIRVLKAFLLEQGLEYRREQIVVITNSSMNCDLVSLEVRQPLQQFYDLMNQLILELKKEFLENDKILTTFIGQRLSVADNIYYCLLDLLAAITKQDKLGQLDLHLLDGVFELLKTLAQNPPLESTLQCRIQLINISDVNKYWSIYKLVKCNQEKLLQHIESGESQKMELGVKITAIAVPADPDEKNISFKESSLIPIRNSLIEQIKSQQIVLIN